MAGLENILSKKFGVMIGVMIVIYKMIEIDKEHAMIYVFTLVALAILYCVMDMMFTWLQIKWGITEKKV